VRDPAWAFADAGKRVERAQQTIRLLRSVIAVERTPVVEGSTTEAALIATESVITFRRRLANGLGPLSSLQAALDLILGDLTNPRSVAFQIERLVEALSVIGDETALAQARSLATRIAGLDLEPLFEEGRTPLSRELLEIGARLREIHAEIDRAHFARKSLGRAVQPVQWSGGQVS